MSKLKRLVNKALNSCGYQLVKLQGKVSTNIEHSDATYSTVRPVATYSPWNQDKDFRNVYQSISDHTLVDQYRCYELWKLVEQSSKLTSGSIIEIGVWRGGSGVLMAKQAKKLGIHEKIYLCDTFSGVVKAGIQDSDYRGGEHADTTRKIVEDLIYSFGLDNTVILEGVFPEETGHYVNSLNFRLCHIDVDVYQSAKDIVDWIWSRMLPGSIIVFDDYGFCGCDGITKYVEEQSMQADRLVVHNLNGHAIIIKS